MSRAVGKAVVAPIGLLAGALTGGAQEVGDTAASALDTLGIGARLFNPLDPFISPPGQAASDHVARGVGRLGRLAANIVRDPVGAVRAAGRVGQSLEVGVSPWMTPTASTVSGELHRNFNIGKNQGRLAVDGGTFIGGEGVAGAIGRPAALPREAQILKRIGQGLTPEKSAYLAEDYVRGMGHHNAPRRLDLWKWLGENDTTKFLRDGPFNVVKPTGISRGDFYELHKGVDPQFNIAVLPKKVGGGVWNGDELGLSAFDGFNRLRFGTPNPLKAVALGGPLAVGGMARSYGEDRRGRAQR